MKRNTTFFAILIALFAIIGTNVSAQTPAVPSPDSGHYYILYSANNGTKDLIITSNGTNLGNPGDTRGKILYAPDNTDGHKLKYGDLTDAPSRDHALWQIEKACDGTLYMKNKATGKYVRESKYVSDNPFEMQIAQEGTSDKYSFRTAKPNQQWWPGYCISWKNNTADSWNPQQGENSPTAWIWEEQPETTPTPTPCGANVTVAGSAEGTAYIEVAGRPTNVQLNTNGSCDIWAVPNAGYKFVKWSDGTNEYTDNPHNYAGSADVTFTATFEKLSTNSNVLTPTNLGELEDKFFYIQSAGTGESAGTDTRDHVLYADGNTAGKLKHNTLSSISDKDYALWFIEGGKLKNKGSKLYMTESWDQGTGDDFEIEAIGNSQYKIKSGGQSPTNAWDNNTANRCNGCGDTKHWYLVYHSDIDLTWIGESYITIGGKDNGGTWYKGSNQAGSMANFEGADLGDKRTSIVLGGQVQAYKPTDNAVQMWYKVVDTTDDSEAIAETSFDLPKELDPQTGENQTNNSRHYGETTIDISALTDGRTYRLEVWFKGVDGSVVRWDSNMNNNYKATFNKIAQNTGLNDIALKHGISVKNGVITVDGVDNFSVFTVSGQKVNANQRLQAGVYVVKVENLVQKVVVK